MLELVGVSEDDLGEGGTTAGVVHDLLDNALDVATRSETRAEPYPSLSAKSRVLN